jgi:hypothetical protein
MAGPSSATEGLAPAHARRCTGGRVSSGTSFSTYYHSHEGAGQLLAGESEAKGAGADDHSERSEIEVTGNYGYSKFIFEFGLKRPSC